MESNNQENRIIMNNGKTKSTNVLVVVGQDVYLMSVLCNDGRQNDRGVLR